MSYFLPGNDQLIASSPAPSAGQIPVYNATTGQWEADDLAAGVAGWGLDGNVALPGQYIGTNNLQDFIIATDSTPRFAVRSGSQDLSGAVAGATTIFSGSNSLTAANQDAPDLILSTGTATGNGSGTIDLRLPTANQGAGATTRNPVSRMLVTSTASNACNVTWNGSNGNVLVQSNSVSHTLYQANQGTMSLYSTAASSETRIGSAANQPNTGAAIVSIVPSTAGNGVVNITGTGSGATTIGANSTGAITIRPASGSSNVILSAQGTGQTVIGNSSSGQLQCQPTGNGTAIFSANGTGATSVGTGGTGGITIGAASKTTTVNGLLKNAPSTSSNGKIRLIRNTSNLSVSTVLGSIAGSNVIFNSLSNVWGSSFGTFNTSTGVFTFTRVGTYLLELAYEFTWSGNSAERILFAPVTTGSIVTNVTAGTALFNKTIRAGEAGLPQTVSFSTTIRVDSSGSTFILAATSVAATGTLVFPISDNNLTSGVAQYLTFTELY